LKVNRVHDASLKKFHRREMPLEKSFQLQVWWFSVCKQFEIKICKTTCQLSKIGSGECRKYWNQCNWCIYLEGLFKMDVLLSLMPALWAILFKVSKISVITVKNNVILFYSVWFRQAVNSRFQLSVPLQF